MTQWGEGKHPALWRTGQNHFASVWGEGRVPEGPTSMQSEDSQGKTGEASTGQSVCMHADQEVRGTGSAGGAEHVFCGRSLGGQRQSSGRDAVEEGPGSQLEEVSGASLPPEVSKTKKLLYLLQLETHTVDASDAAGKNASLGCVGTER